MASCSWSAELRIGFSRVHFSAMTQQWLRLYTPSTPCSTRSEGRLTTPPPSPTENQVRPAPALASPEPPVAFGFAHGTPLLGGSHKKYSTPFVHFKLGASHASMGSACKITYMKIHCPILKSTSSAIVL